jgi:hypothetical protein
MVCGGRGGWDMFAGRRVEIHGVVAEKREGERCWGGEVRRLDWPCRLRRWTIDVDCTSGMETCGCWYD